MNDHYVNSRRAVDKILSECQPLGDNRGGTEFRLMGVKNVADSGLYFHPSLTYWRTDVEPPLQFQPTPAVVAPIRDVQGEVCGLHIRYYDQDKSLHPVKQIVAHDWTGGGVKLEPVVDMGGVAVCVNITQGMAVRGWHLGTEVYCCLSPQGLEDFIPPSQCDSSGLMIFVDDMEDQYNAAIKLQQGLPGHIQADLLVPTLAQTWQAQLSQLPTKEAML